MDSQGKFEVIENIMHMMDMSTVRAPTRNQGGGTTA